MTYRVTRTEKRHETEFTENCAQITSLEKLIFKIIAFKKVLTTYIVVIVVVVVVVVVVSMTCTLCSYKHNNIKCVSFFFQFLLQLQVPRQ